jgi:hypothetical protein
VIGAATVIALDLASDATVAALATGGIWDRPLARDGWRSTPDAYVSGPSRQIRPAVVVTDNGDSDDALGPASARMGFVQVWLHAMNTDPGRNALTALAAAIAARYPDDPVRIVGDIGLGGAEVTYADRLGLIEDPGDDKQLMDYLRLQVSGLEGGSD